MPSAADLKRYKELQDAELAALQAIYDEDYREVKSAVPWASVNAQRECEIDICPDLDQSVRDHVKLTLHFTLVLGISTAGILIS